MKELSIEEKAKAYDEALKVLHKYDGANIMFSQSLKEEMFPELKESEDEEIRNRLINYFYGFLDGHEDVYKVGGHVKWEGLDVKDAIAWLEKQGEQKPFDYENANIQQKDFAPKSAMEAIREEKIDNQNCVKADKVEPKFHEGEWVVYECGEETATLQITRIVGETYVFSDDSTLSVVDEDALRLWDITKDAKDGDVLAEDSCIFIIQKLGDNGTAAKTYCTLYNDGDFDDGSILYFDIDSTKPATKEQRDTLMKAMADAGWEFDFEKKELRKIEQKPSDEIGNYDHGKVLDALMSEKKTPAWSERDELMLEASISFIKSSPYPYFGDTLRGEISKIEAEDWLKSLKDRVQPQPKQEWSKEDEVMIKVFNSIIRYIVEVVDKDALERFGTKREELFSWLKSLRPQNT